MLLAVLLLPNVCRLSKQRIFSNKCHILCLKTQHVIVWGQHFKFKAEKSVLKPSVLFNVWKTMCATLKFGLGDVDYVYPRHLNPECEERGSVHGWSGKGWVCDDSAVRRGALLSRPPTHPTPSAVRFPCPGPTSAPVVEGQPMTHCIMDFGVLGRPACTCLPLTQTTAAAVTSLDGWLTSWQLDIGIVHMLVTDAWIRHRSFPLCFLLQ